MGIANRIFNDTTDMRPDVKKRLQELQNLASGIYDSRNASETEEIKNSANFNGQGYLSGKTPFARMWTAVRVTKPTEPEEDIIITEKPDPSTFDFENYSYEFPRGSKSLDYKGSIIKKTKLAKFPESGYKIYSLGMNASEQDIFGSKDGSGDISEIGTQLLPSQKRSFTNFGIDGETKNLRPPAGITSVTSTTQNSLGPVAGILKTSVTFTVYDYTEFDQIFSKYFMRPAAKVFVDFGYTDATGFKLYNPATYIESIGDVSDYNEMIYGADGQVAQSKYGIQCIQGQVTNFSSDIDAATGAYKCRVDITSKNMQLFDVSFKEDSLSDIKKNILSNLDYKILQATEGAINSKGPLQGQDADISTKEYKAIADLFAAEFLSAGENNYPDTSNTVLGVFWKGSYKTGEDEEKIPITGEDSLYISIGYMEDVIINGEFGKYTSELNQYTDFNAVEFNSNNSYTTFDTTLEDRQRFLTNNKKLPLLYPANWDDTYNTRKRKVPEDSSTTPEYEESGMTRTEYDKKAGRIPIREMFIKLALVKQAVKTADSSKELFQYIFNKVKDSTGGGWSWGMDSSTANNTTLAILDRNFSSKKFYSEDEKIEKSQEAEEFYKNMFMFEPFSDKSIIKNMSMNFSPGDGTAISSKLALQSLGNAGRSIFATSELIDQTQRQMVLEDLQDDGTYKSIYNVEFFPPTEAFSDLERIFSSFESPKDEIADPTLLSSANIYGDQFDNFSPSTGGGSSTDYAVKSSEIIEELGESGDRQPSSKPSVEFKEFKAYLENSNFEFSSNPYEYFTKEYFVNSIKTRPTILPIKLSLTLHGFTGLEPSDRFKINHIPSRYMNFVFFQIMRITHSISPGKFDTQVECAMRLRDTINEKLPINNDKRNVMVPHALKNLHKLPEIEKIMPFLGFIKPSVLHKNTINDVPLTGDKDHNLNDFRTEDVDLIGMCEYAYVIRTLPAAEGITNYLDAQIESTFSADVFETTVAKDGTNIITKEHNNYKDFVRLLSKATGPNKALEIEEKIGDPDEQRSIRLRYKFKPNSQYVIFISKGKFVIWPEFDGPINRDAILYYFSLSTGQFGPPEED